MNGVVENPLMLQVLMHRKKRLSRAMKVVSLYRCKTVSELLIAIQKDLDIINERIEKETK